MSSWKAKAAEKRRQQYETIPSAWRLPSLPTSPTLNTAEYLDSCPILSVQDQNITAITDGKVLQRMLQTGEVTSEAVVTAFCKRAAVAQQVIGCCTEMFFESAIEKAKELDVKYKETGPVGPLHGIPVSFKDNFDIEGLDTTIGWVGKIGKPAVKNSLGVDLLLKLGAVVYCKTNIPQSLMMSDSYNHVFKQSVNSLNKALISGGSSGGEGALVGARASILGIGTDIGGSVRIPAVLQGLYGMCPTVGRVPNDNSARTQNYIVLPVAGPLTTSLSTVELYFESLLDSQPWNVDPGLLPIPWSYEVAKKPKRRLKLAFIVDDGIIKPQPPVERITRKTAEKLRAAGHEVIEWDSKMHVEAYELWLEAVLADGGEGCKELCLLANEPLVEGMLVGKAENFLSPKGRRDVEERKLAFQKKYLKHWMDSGIDGLVMPVLPWVGFPPRAWVQSQQWVGYTGFVNFINYAALTIPAASADPLLDQPSEAWLKHVPRNESDDFNHKQYDIELVKGMPVGLQIIGGRFGEERCVSIAKVIQELVSKSNS